MAFRPLMQSVLRAQRDREERRARQELRAAGDEALRRARQAEHMARQALYGERPLETRATPRKPPEVD